MVPYNLETDARDFITDGIVVGGESFTVRFQFDKKSRFSKYSYEGYPHPPSVFEEVIRPQIEALIDYFSNLFGPPTEFFRIGFFDVKQDTTTVVAVWPNDTAQIYVELSQRKNLYTAQARVVWNDTLAVMCEDSLAKKQ